MSTAGVDTTAAGVTILVADDDEDILRLISRRLSSQGYRILTAENGPDALALALAEAPDAAILDGIMPGLQGHEVCARMRADARTAHIPVMLLTAKAGDIDEREADDAGADAFVGKPFGFDQLDRKLRELLSGATEPAP
jgi:CheY-like chemotaxis protein